MELKWIVSRINVFMFSLTDLLIVCAYSIVHSNITFCGNTEYVCKSQQWYTGPVGLQYEPFACPCLIKKQRPSQSEDLQ